jgi:hypothetical protein
MSNCWCYESVSASILGPSLELSQTILVVEAVEAVEPFVNCLMAFDSTEAAVKRLTVLETLAVAFSLALVVVCTV